MVDVHPNPESGYYVVTLDTTTGEITTAPGTSSAEFVQSQIENSIPEDQRRKAAADFYARLLANTPPAYRDPWLTNALMEGIETTLGLRKLPPEQGEQ